MSASEWAAVAVVGVAVLLALALVLVLRSVLRTLASLTAVLADLNHEAVALLSELRGDAAEASAHLERAGDLVGAAESVTRTVEGASRLAYVTFSNPLVKVLALLSGIGRAGRRLRRRGT
ncbi:MAG: hypothetical protein M3357_17760 [Actinomycetota bacterium]|nr:hypothetical protein [Actinomycetota bacterium]